MFKFFGGWPFWFLPEHSVLANPLRPDLVLLALIGHVVHILDIIRVRVIMFVALQHQQLPDNLKIGGFAWVVTFDSKHWEMLWLIPKCLCLVFADHVLIPASDEGKRGGYNYPAGNEVIS